MGQLIEACPECDTSDIYGLVGSPFGDDDADHKYRCRRCGEAFDEPVRRDPHSPGGGGSTTTRRLERMDPDDLGGEA